MHTLPEIFALACGRALETPAADLIGEKALEILLVQARLSRKNALIAYGLYGLSVSMVAFVGVALSVARGGIVAMVASPIALMTFGYARSLVSRKYEPTLAELLLAAETEAERDCIRRLEAIRVALGQGEIIATFDHPRGLAGKDGGDRVRPEVFSADYGRLLILLNDHAWAVRTRPPVRPVPIRALVSKTPRSEWRHWLAGMSPEQAEDWYNEFCKQTRITIDTRDRHVVVFRCACEILGESPRIDQATFLLRVLKRVAEHPDRLGLNDNSIRRLVGDNRSDAHRYGAFRMFVLDRKALTRANPGL